ncbi:hypothetical protein PIB30_027440 [Stylosanthes scabra]|uniref:Uncharacterized protein n=1 Tax=Stylosanthes scabra TaxID=79078 RepID=A0ABU6X8U9_9FABA|nr:hypothetical protein [Stylosanthes scabra]
MFCRRSCRVVGGGRSSVSVLPSFPVDTVKPPSPAPFTRLEEKLASLPPPFVCRCRKSSPELCRALENQLWPLLLFAGTAPFALCFESVNQISGVVLTDFFVSDFGRRRFGFRYPFGLSLSFDSLVSEYEPKKCSTLEMGRKAIYVQERAELFVANVYQHLPVAKRV